VTADQSAGAEERPTFQTVRPDADPVVVALTAADPRTAFLELHARPARAGEVGVPDRQRVRLDPLRRRHVDQPRRPRHRSRGRSLGSVGLVRVRLGHQATHQLRQRPHRSAQPARCHRRVPVRLAHKAPNKLPQPPHLSAPPARGHPRVNATKRDRDPMGWLPPNNADTCRYVGDWLSIKARWHLTIDTAEATTVSNLLNGTCSGLAIAPWPPAP
jgi:hypothetical protein